MSDTRSTLNAVDRFIRNRKVLESEQFRRLCAIKDLNNRLHVKTVLDGCLHGRNESYMKLINNWRPA